MLAKYIGEGQYLRVLLQSVWGDPIVCHSLEEALQLPVHDKAWLGIEVTFISYRNNCPDAMALISDNYIEYESEFVLPNGTMVAKTHPSRATHVVISHPINGKPSISQLTIEEYKRITVPKCPYCQSSNVCRAGQKTTTQSIVQQWRCSDCSRRFQR